MKHVLLATVFVVLHGTTMAQPTIDADLSDLRWKNRVLIVFAPAASNPARISMQRAVSDRQADVEDRDLVFIEIIGRDIGRVNNTPLPEEANPQFRDRFRVDLDTFRVYLIGKDGTVKLQEDEDVQLSAIFARIDTMPMRRQEMKKKSSNP